MVSSENSRQVADWDMARSFAAAGNDENSATAAMTPLAANAQAAAGIVYRIELVFMFVSIVPRSVGEWR
jgi:hypothetical protein